MTMIMYFIFFLTASINFIYGVVKKKNLILYGFSLVIIFLLMTFNFDGPDVVVYKLAYEIVGKTPSTAYETTYMEWGYTSLMILGNKIGLNFFAFRIILSFICLSLFCSSIKYYKANGNLIIGLYMLYLFFFDAIQLRNCISQFIILFATRYLSKKSWGSTLKYILCVVIAAGFHKISWLYITFLLINVSQKEKFFKNLFVFVIALFLLCVIAKPVFLQLVNMAAGIIGHGSNYLHGTIAYGFWIVLALHLIGIIPLYLFKNGVKDDGVRANIEIIIKLNIILCLFLPLTLLNNNFNRIFRNNMILTQIGVALMYSHSNKSSNSSKAAMGSLILLTGGWLVSDMMRYEVAKIISPIIENNLIFASNSLADIVLYIAVTAICLLLTFVAFKVKSNRLAHKFEQDNTGINVRQN
ncbi:MAG: EpsG family protein [Clostridia bacterium]|nr:EpsG family protein [Clostridia bacterium]